MLCLSAWLSNLWSWISGKEQNASCDLSSQLEDDKRNE